MAVYDFERPERFVAGTVGPPGQRTFFVQVRDGRRLVSVSCEKEQLSVLADRLLDLLDDLAGAGGGDAAAAQLTDDAPLDTPIEDEFRANTVSLGWDGEAQAVLLEVQREDDAEADGGEPSDALRVVLGAAQARAFARRVQALVAAGRPPCPFCGQPLDPRGHVCPRANGYRR